MQVFLPYSSFTKSASVLDRARLGKQRSETLILIKAALDPDYGWQNHPCTNQWRSYLGYLVKYQEAVCHEWTSVRGYKDTCLQKTYDLVRGLVLPSDPPPWLGDEQFHLSHQSNLIRKDPEHYGPLFPDVPDDLEYVWPSP